MRKEIKRVYREIIRAFDESASYPLYKGAILRIWEGCKLPWDIFKRLVDDVCSI